MIRTGTEWKYSNIQKIHYRFRKRCNKTDISIQNGSTHAARRICARCCCGTGIIRAIVLWSIGNEVPEQLSEDGYQLAARLKEIVRSLDPTRKITQANDQISAEPKAARETFLNTLDVVGYNYVDRWRERAELLYGADRVKHPDRCVIGSENPSAGYVRNDTGSGGSLWSSPYYVTPVRVGHVLRYTMTHAFVAGDYMWTGADYLGEAAWPGRSRSCGVFDTCSYEKDGYYFYRNIWNRTDPMVYLCPHWNLSCEPVHLAISGPAELLGMDNGRPDCHLLFQSADYETFAGRAFAVLRPTGVGTVAVTVESDGPASGSVRVPVTGKRDCSHDSRDRG